MDKSFERRSKREKTTKKRGFPYIAGRTLIAAGLGIVTLAAVGALGSTLDDPDRYTPVFALTVLFGTSFFGGMGNARTWGEKGALCGLLSGLTLIGILLLSTFAFGYSIHLPLFAVGAPAILLFSMFGGAVGARKRSQNHSKRKKHF